MLIICNSDNNIEHKIWANSSLFISNKFEFLWNSQVEVRESEGGTIDIHVSCTHKSDILFSTMKALDSLGLDVHQAVINCFNGFSIDVFKAKVHILFLIDMLYMVFYSFKISLICQFVILRKMHRILYDVYTIA
jgi:hypothetical protein